MSASELQHYVPRFLLRKFGLGKKDRVYVFDKQKDCTFVSNAKAVAAENGFYDFEFMGTPMTLEPSLSKLESNAAQHLAQIEESHRLPEPLSEARVQLAWFLAVQMVRTRARLNTFNDISQRMETWLRAQGMNEDYFAPDPKIGGGENARKALLARQITNAPKDFAPALLEKDWLLLQTTRQHPFIIGDSPLAMFNSVDRGPRGNLGLDVDGIELYLPINPQLTLGLVCPTLTEALSDGAERYARLSHLPDAHARFGSAASGASNILDAIAGGIPFSCAPENVEFYNSLQVIEAERFVFSMSDDFRLVREMITSDPTLRLGPRMVEGTGKF